MTHRVFNMFLAVLLVVCVILVWVLEPDPTVPNAQFLPGMHYSIPLNAQSANLLMLDGKTLQTPPNGTIARGSMPYTFGADSAGRSSAGANLIRPPGEDSLKALERGARQFAVYCQPCHGALGEGNGTLTRYGFPPPPSFAAPNVLQLRDGEIFHTMTFGKGNMPGLAGQVSRADRWDILLRIRQLQANLHRGQSTQTAASSP